MTMPNAVSYTHLDVYKRQAYDSLLEERFATRWDKLGTPWILEREVEIVDLKGTVFVPDFALRHPDGRVAHIEIMGFWHPDYLRRKLDKLRRAAMPDLIVAVSERLNVGATDFQDIPGPVLFFKGCLLYTSQRRITDRIGARWLWQRATGAGGQP